MNTRLELRELLTAIDSNTRELWSAADEDQQKGIKGDLFRLNRYISNVKSNNREKQEHFVLAVNEYFNKNWFTIQKHPQLLWMLLCMCNYDGNTIFYHEWIGYKKLPKKNNNKKVKFLAEIYPIKKMKEIEMLAEMMTDKEVKALAKEYGLSDLEVSHKFK